MEKLLRPSGKRTGANRKWDNRSRETEGCIGSKYIRDKDDVEAWIRTVPWGHIYLNAWSPVGAFGEGLGGVASLVTLGEGLRFQKTSCHSRYDSLSLSASHFCPGCALSAAVQLPVTTSLLNHHRLQPSETIARLSSVFIIYLSYILSQKQKK